MTKRSRSVTAPMRRDEGEGLEERLVLEELAGPVGVERVVAVGLPRVADAVGHHHRVVAGLLGRPGQRQVEGGVGHRLGVGEAHGTSRTGRGRWARRSPPLYHAAGDAHPASPTARADPRPGTRLGESADLALGCEEEARRRDRRDALRLLRRRGRGRTAARRQRRRLVALAAPPPGPGRRLVGLDRHHRPGLAGDLPVPGGPDRHPAAWPTPRARWPRPGALPPPARAWSCPPSPPGRSRTWRPPSGGAPQWMQVYVLRDRGRTAELVARAAAAGFGALVLTVDAPVSGLRLRELRGGVHLPEDLASRIWPGPSTERAREGGFMAVVSRRVRPGPHLRRRRLAGRPGRPPGGGEGGAAGRRRRPLRRGRGGGGHRLQPRGPPARRRTGHRRRPGRGGRRGRRAGGGLRRRRHPPCRRRRQGAGPGRPGGAGGPAGPVVAGHRGRTTGWLGCSAGSRPSSAGPWPCAGPPRSTDLDRSPRPARAPRRGQGGPAGDHRGTRLLLAARADDDHPGGARPRPGRGPGARRWPPAAARGVLARSLRAPGPFHVGVLLPNVPEYLFWLNGAALAGAAVVGHQPHPAGRGAGRRRAGHRLPAARDRRRGRGAARGPRPRARPDRVLVVGTVRLRRRLPERANAGGDEARRRWSSRGRRGRRGPALPAAVHLGHHRHPQGRALHPGAAGQDRRSGGPRLRLPPPRASATAPCPCSTATP